MSSIFSLSVTLILNQMNISVACTGQEDGGFGLLSENGWDLRGVKMYLMFCYYS